MYIWDKVWYKDIYADMNVRNRKAVRKLHKYAELGMDFKRFHSIIDFGSGGGYVIAALMRINANINEVVLLDNSSIGLKKAKANLSKYQDKCRFIKKDLNIPIHQKEKKFDLAIAFSILEHLDNVEQGINNIYESLETNGEVIMIWSNKKSVFYLQHKIFERLGIWRYGLTKEITEDEIDSLLAEKFTLILETVEPCVGDKGILTLVDQFMHKCFPWFGRYIFLHLKKVGQ